MNEIPPPLRAFVRHQRLAMLKQYADPVLDLGTHIDRFQYYDTIFPIMGMGPKGGFVPFGAGVQSDGVPRYPHFSVERRDCIRSYDVRSQTRHDCSPIGGEVLPENDLGRWHSVDTASTLAAGVFGPFNMMAAVPDMRIELVINSIRVVPVANVAPVVIAVEYGVSGGAVLGAGLQTNLVYVYDPVTPDYIGPYEYQSMGDKRMITEDQGERFTMEYSGGAGVEVLIVSFEWRAYP